MKILVSGGNGLIGQAICRQLETDNQLSVFSPSRQAFDLLIEDERWDTILKEDWDLLIHCAWVTDHGNFWASPQNNQWRDASSRLFQRFFEKPNRRIVSLGTCAEYDWSSTELPLSEQSTCKPETLYGQAKYQTYLALKDCARRSGNSFLWPRIFFTFGSGESEKKLMPAMVNAELSQTTMQCGPAKTGRDFSSFDAIGTAIAQLALSPCEGAVNIGCGESISLEDIYQVIAERTTSQSYVSFKEDSSHPPSSIIANVEKAQQFGVHISKQAMMGDIKAYVDKLAS